MKIHACLASPLIDLVSSYFIQKQQQSKLLQSSFCLVSGFVVRQVGSFSMLYLHSLVYFPGCFKRVLHIFIHFCDESPSLCLVMHFVIMRHMPFYLEVFVLYPSVLTSDDALAENVCIRKADGWHASPLTHTYTNTRSLKSDFSQRF